MTERDEKGEKKGILSWISDALYEKVEAEEPAPAAAPAPAARVRTAAPGAAPSSPAPEAVAENPADLAARLREQVAAQGEAFTKFLALVASFADIIPDEAGRYRAALTALEKTGGVTAEQVLLAGKDQLQALDSQREAFAEAVARRREALRKSGGTADAIRAKIAELEQALAALRERERQIAREGAAEEAKVRGAEERFAALLGTLQDEITAAREKIKKHLG